VFFTTWNKLHSVLSIKILPVYKMFIGKWEEKRQSKLQRVFYSGWKPVVKTMVSGIRHLV
jgi:hypothetical protein